MQNEPSDTVIAHLFRGELSREIAYRVRLDTTTNWAIGLSAAMISFALGHPEIPHTVVLVALAIDLLLMWLEARRYRAYQLSRHRVRLLERGFVAQVLGEGAPWREELRRSYSEAVPPMGIMAAAARRVRRNYLWLVTFVEAAWVLKVYLHGGTNLIDGAAIGLIPGWFTLACATLLLLVLITAALLSPNDPAD